MSQFLEAVVSLTHSGGTSLWWFITHPQSWLWPLGLEST